MHTVRAMDEQHEELAASLYYWFSQRQKYGNVDPMKSSAKYEAARLKQYEHELMMALDDYIDQRIREFIVIPEDNDGKT